MRVASHPGLFRCLIPARTEVCVVELRGFEPRVPTTEVPRVEFRVLGVNLSAPGVRVSSHLLSVHESGIIIRIASMLAEQRI